ncbi:MAG: hypothetical protein IT385_01920 [Deltaproteobacteria bacterium]|nr:hypothetical protein [Deltaproteobacteria bacterium]
MFLTLACSPAAQARKDPKAKAAAAPPAAFTFAWPLGATFEVVATSVREGETLELKTKGTVAAHDADNLELSFEAPKLGARDKKLVAPGKSHAYLDLWPGMVVAKKNAEIVGFGEEVPGEGQGVILERWSVWTTLVGFDLPRGERREIQGEVELADGLIAPVRIVESHEEAPGGGARVTVKRLYDGDVTRKLWIMQQSEAGAKKAELDAITAATQEQNLVIDVDPATLRPTRVDYESTFTVTSKGPRGDKVDVHAKRDTWTFTWSK